MHFDDGAAEAPGRPVPLVELRAPSRVGEAATGRGVLDASDAGSGAWLAVDHDCDGGRWICIGSFQTIYPKVHETPRPCGASGALTCSWHPANTPCVPR